MNKECFDKIVEFGINLGWTLDQMEITNFLEELAKEYELEFNPDEYLGKCDD